ncbi:hypothetical protein [Seonamhaeicola maritimus]|uniref:hypothetical protein n=1 Tax=Seonamhaeicola maritimus TaxID=2591822 RepID=UPI0024947D25|nr:hypothetical protein [Seonamhaeicola maritimus]
MSEFGGAAKAGKALREAFSGVVKLMSDTYFSARINALMKRVNSMSAGTRGERAFEIVGHSDMFRGLEFNLKTPLDSQFFAPYDAPSINASRDVVTLDIPDFDTANYINAPEGATHCRLVLAAGYVSDYAYVPAVKGYEPDDEAVNGRGDVVESSDIVLGGMVGSATNLVVDLSSLGTIPVDSALFGSIGIVYYQEINGSLYVLAQGNAMKVIVSG